MTQWDILSLRLSQHFWGIDICLLCFCRESLDPGKAWRTGVTRRWECCYLRVKWDGALLRFPGSRPLAVSKVKLTTSIQNKLPLTTTLSLFLNWERSKKASRNCIPNTCTEIRRAHFGNSEISGTFSGNSSLKSYGLVLKQQNMLYYGPSVCFLALASFIC